MKQFFVTDYGAVADGVTLCTESVQRAVDDCASNGGGTVVFPCGNYVLSTVFIRSNVHIRFQDGTVILGASFDDYASEEKIDYPLYQDSSHSYFHCSMFVGIDCNHISLCGNAVIDMRSFWDEKGVRGKAIKHRGAKCLALKNCSDVTLQDFSVLNATDLAVYFAGCNDVTVSGLHLKVYIDGISPDNSKNVVISNCDIEAGDDALVFKSSYTLNRLDYCQNIKVDNCKLKSRCNAIKFGTETNGGFYGISISNTDICDTRIAGIAIESVDGATVDGIAITNVTMSNVNVPFFVHLGDRLRGPQGSAIGTIRNVTLENISAGGPYHDYDIMAWNYDSFKAGDFHQDPRVFGIAENFDGTTPTNLWQMSSNVCGLVGHRLENIVFRNVNMQLVGGVQEYCSDVTEKPLDYPEAYVYGRILPSKGIFFRHIDGLTLDNVKVTTLNGDNRQDFVFVDVNNLRKC